MKHISRTFILILIQMLIAGCAKPTLPPIGAIFEVHGTPHILQDGVCYYVGPWGPGATVLKIYYKGSSEKDNSNLPRTVYANGDLYYQQVTSIEWEYIEEDDLHFYIPLLIESLKDTQPGGKGTHSLRFLYTVLSMGTPREYLINNTPIDSISEFRNLRSNRFPKVDQEAYSKWKHWWETKGHSWYPKK